MQCQENHTTSELHAVFYLNFHVTGIHGDLTVPSAMFTVLQPRTQSRGAPSHTMLTYMTESLVDLVLKALAASCGLPAENHQHHPFLPSPSSLPKGP